MKKLLYIIITAIIGISTPLISYGATLVSNGTTLASNATFKDLINFFISYINQGIYLILGLCMLFFVWGVYKHFFYKSDSADSRAEGAQFVMYAIVAFFIVLSIWGLVNILLTTFGFGSSNTGKTTTTITTGNANTVSSPSI